jgi:hypothetical protein
VTDLYQRPLGSGARPQVMHSVVGRFDVRTSVIEWSVPQICVPQQ